MTIIAEMVTPVKLISSPNYAYPMYIKYVNNETFIQWLNQELDKRDWTRGKLARVGGFSHVALVNIYNGKRGPGVEICEKIARALQIPPETVFRQAGLLPNDIDASPEFEKLKYWFGQMTNEEQEAFLEQGRAIVNVRKNRPKEWNGDEWKQLDKK